VVPPPPPPKSKIEALPGKREFEISWPNVVRIEHSYEPLLSLEPSTVSPLHIQAADTAMLAELAPVVDGKPDVTRLTAIHIAELAHRFRVQKIVFETARDVFDQMRHGWS